ncbi:hydroxyacid dehydrogenase [Eubacteriales bacterium OttesenSCG-928-A19]|nr:hydroxyacid dehydrogenase [Eubacteriales bacterium OttesenSCG-928-A19]
MSKPYKVAILVENELAHSIFRQKDLDFLGSFAEVNSIDALPETISTEFMTEQLQGAQACITCWRTPSFTEEMLAQTPELRLIAHAAGAVRSLVPASFWTSGKHITSNAPVIAEDVSQTVLALVLTSLKQMWAFSKYTAAGGWGGGEKGSFTTKRLDELNVGIVGCSLVGKEVIKILRPYRCNLSVWDPYLSPMEAEMLDVKQIASIDELISTSDVLTLHAPANPDCRHLLNANNIPLIRDGALVINTARGMLIDEAPFIKELQKNRFFACLDVTDPEPPADDHPFLRMENVILTPHIAGGHTMNGRHMLGRNSIKEVYNYLIKGLIAYEVRGEMLDHMA